MNQLGLTQPGHLDVKKHPGDFSVQTRWRGILVPETDDPDANSSFTIHQLVTKKLT